MARFISWDNYFQRRKFRKRYAHSYAGHALGTFPVSEFEGQSERLAEVFEKMPGPKYFAETSGTTREPKKIPYDLRRTKNLQKSFLRSMITLTSDTRGKKTFFVFASLKKDHSLTSGMMEEGKEPSYLELLQAPYRYLHTKEGRALSDKIGELSARIMVLVVTQPRFLYATNPSTLTFFLKELDSRWKEVRVRLKGVPPGLMRLKDGDAERRIMSFVIREKAPKLQELLPELKAVITWDGGYVKPFLDQLKTSLPGIKFIPMYSMSTETVETFPHRIGNDIRFLPLVKGMYPEFRNESTGKILTPFEMEKGQIYELIASDDFGLRRYSTRDLFQVREMIDGIPDLVFLRRKGLTSSLTGEKITEEQVRDLSSLLRKKFPELGQYSISLFPVSREKEMGYELAVIGKLALPGTIDRVAEEELSKINSEYASKVSSGRLKPITVSVLSEQDLAALMGKKLHWESQFKVLPLYEKIVSR